MQPQPGRHRLIEDELGVLMPAAREHHDEDPRAADAPDLGIEHLAGEAEVDLRLVAGRDQAGASRAALA